MRSDGSVLKKNKQRAGLNKGIGRSRFKLEEEDDPRWGFLLRWALACRRRRRPPELPQTTTKLNKIYIILFVFSQGIQKYKWFSLIPHRNEKTKRTKSWDKNAKTQNRPNWTKLANQKASKHLSETNGVGIYLDSLLNRPTWARFLP